MKEVLIIGSGLSGMACAVRCAAAGVRVTLISPYPSERSQSVMAAGGINAVTQEHEEGDSVGSHIEDTLKGGAWLGGRNAVTGMCSRAEEIIRYLEGIGTVFSVDGQGRPLRRAFGGQSHKRTHYCGSATGKQIISAFVMEARRYEAAGMITRRMRMFFNSALIRDGVCYGALLFDERKRVLEPVYADAVIIASGGQNSLFGKTTGSSLCDGYTAGKLFRQGAVLKNLEFIQYHPTTLETAQKRMLISEAVLGEGGRLFTIENGKRVYFMEEKYGPRGNLMTRDVVSREIQVRESQVFLDISFLEKKLIETRLSEVYDLCMKYRGIDISKEPIPVAPSVHYFMGGLAVHLNHETNIRHLYAVGECASMYHGANRLGGNSLLSAIYSGFTAADDISGREAGGNAPDFREEIEAEERSLAEMLRSKSSFPVMYIRDMLADTMRDHLGIVRNEESLGKGITDVDYYLSTTDRIRYDSSVSAYTNYSLKGILTLARAVLTCAEARKESRGAHFRSDFPELSDDFSGSTLISYENGAYRVWQDREGEYEN
ncbi:MAG: FAD-binding protein [Anaerolineaceae bacterium]|nr:FAD-binding protein [Anaerolineaceae bacterium]